MNFKSLLLGASCIVVFGSIGSAIHYKTQAKITALEVTRLQAEKQQNAAMLMRFEQQNAQLHQKLNQLNQQAERRSSQLKEILNRENNQAWRDQPVPDDVIRLFNTSATGK